MSNGLKSIIKTHDQNAVKKVKKWDQSEKNEGYVLTLQHSIYWKFVCQ